MSVLGVFRKLFARAPQYKGLTISRVTRSDILEARAIYEGAVGDGWTSDVIMSPITWIAMRMAESPVGIRGEDEEEIDFDHDCARLIKYPNAFYCGSVYKMALAIDYLLDGNAYSIKIRNGMKKVIGLQFVPHWAMEPHVPDDLGELKYYDYNPGGRYGRIPVPASDVVHLRNGIDPENVYKGFSSLKILLREIYTDDEAAVFTAMMLKNGGVPGVVFSPASVDAVLNEKDIATEKIRLKEEFSGTRRGDPLLMRAPTKIDQLGVDAGKLDLSRLREIPEERVTALLHVPAAVVGFGTGLQQTKVGATMAEMRAMAYEDCIIPMQMLWTDIWDLQLLPEFEESPRGFRMVFDLSGVRCLREDQVRKSEMLNRQLSVGGIKLSEWRERMGYEIEPEHEIWYLPMATVVVPDGNLVQEPAKPGEESPKGAVRPPLKARASAATARFQHELARAHDRMWKAWASKLARIFRDLGDVAADEWLRFADARGIKALKMAEDPRSWATLITAALDLPDLGYDAQFLVVGKATYGLIEAFLGLVVNLDAPAEVRILQAAGTRKGLLDLAQQTRDALFDAISEGRTEGMGPVELAEKIKDAVGAGPWRTPETRAMVISRTETKYAQNKSTIEAYKGVEGATAIIVYDAQLGPTDAECELLNGQIVSFARAEELAASEHPNGTRSFAPYMGEV